MSAVTVLSQQLHNALGDAASVDWSFALKALDHLSANPAEANKLGAHPEEYLRSKGFTIPPGFHAHYIDAAGNRYPPEPAVDPQQIIVRPIVEVSKGQHTLGFCIAICQGC